jgi:hypothetical protein
VHRFFLHVLDDRHKPATRERRSVRRTKTYGGLTLGRFGLRSSA